MGFDASLTVYPKYKDITYDQLQVIMTMLDYESSEWAKKNNLSLEDYCKSNLINKENINLINTITTDMLDYYRRNATKDEYGYTQYGKEYAYWCSNGSGDIYEKIVSFGSSADTPVILIKENICELLEFCWETMKTKFPSTARITHAFVYDNKEDEDGYTDEEPDIILRKCDGVEIEFEDGSLRREATNDFEFGFGVIKNGYYDEWTDSAYIVGIEACISILKETNFENSFVVYHGGW